MDEKQLKDMLSSLAAPEPSKEAKNQALERAMAAFDENMDRRAQGSRQAHRLTSINHTLSQVRRWIMNKRYIVSGTTGAVAVCALVAVLGAPFFHQQVERITGGEQAKPVIKGRMGSATFSDMSNNIVAPSRGWCLFGCDAKEAAPAKVDADALKMQGNAELFLGGGDETYRKAVEESNRKAMEQAKQSGGSAMPIPLSTVEPKAVPAAPAESVANGGGVILPVTPPPVPQDPLRQWRQEVEARHLRTEEAPRAEGQELKKERADEAAPLRRRLMPDQAAPAAPAPQAAGAAMTSEAEMAAPASSFIAPMPVPMPPVDIVQPAYRDVGRDQFQKFEENSVKNVQAEPVSTFSIDVDTASYAFARKAINQGYLPSAHAVRIEEMINYFDYDYAVPEAGGHPFQPTVAVYDSPWRSGTKLVHIGIKGYEVQEDVRSNLVFLIDTSGSMNSPDKLPLLVNSFKMMLDGLSPDDTVGIVTYAGSAGTVLAPTKAADKHKIIQALERLHAGGSTAGAAGIQQAYALAESAFIKGGNNRIILATDGDFNVGITNRDELKSFIERKRDAGVSLSVLGFGQGNYNDHLMQVLAQNGNGNAAYIDTLTEARKVLVEEASATLFTIAKDVKVQVEFNPALVQEYRLIGYETRHLNREDFNNDKVDAGEVGAGHAVTAIYEITPVGMQPMVDDLRYQRPAADTAEKTAAAPQAEGMGNEYAFLKIRYKRPDENTSILMTQPITTGDEQSFDALPDDIRFASAVAGFAQLLKGSKFTGTLDYDRVIEIANAARGRDEFGYRAEFVNLVRLAKSAAAMQGRQ